MEGTDAARLADCLGLDPARFRGSTGSQTAADARDDALLASGASLDDESLYKVGYTQPYDCHMLSSSQPIL